MQEKREKREGEKERKTARARFTVADAKGFSANLFRWKLKKTRDGGILRDRRRARVFNLDHADTVEALLL